MTHCNRLLALLLTLLLSFSCIPAAFGASSFSDVPASHWAYSYVNEMQSAGLVNGTGNGKFSPGGTLTRAQFLAMAVRLLDSESGTANTANASNNYWAAPYYTRADQAYDLFGNKKSDSDALTLSGFTAGKDTLEKGISRYEMAVLANNALATLSGYTYNISSVNVTVMPDYNAIPGIYKSAVCRMYSLGILKGQDDGNFNGSKTLTRAESCAVLSRLKAQYESIRSGGLRVDFIDVGQADSALIVCNGEAMLIDGGNVADSDLLYAYLKKNQITHLKYVVATHAHEDHVGGLAGALHYAAADTAFCSVSSYNSAAFNNFVKALAAQGKTITVPKIGSSYTLGGASFQFVGPISASTEPNNTSLVLRLSYGNTSFLFTGDAEASEEKEILAAGYSLQSTVLKVGHHGSDTSTSYAFLRAVAPRYAIISVGVDNDYGHPSETVLSRLRDAEVKLYRTDLQGTVLCVSDGVNVTFTTDRNATIQTNPTQNAPAADYTYIGNANSKIFHRSTCSSLPAEQNRVYFSSRAEAVAAGYTPCGRCQP